jgi:hypothetical protein
MHGNAHPVPKPCLIPSATLSSQRTAEMAAQKRLWRFGRRLLSRPTSRPLRHHWGDSHQVGGANRSTSGAKCLTLTGEAIRKAVLIRHYPRQGSNKYGYHRENGGVNLRATSNPTSGSKTGPKRRPPWTPTPSWTSPPASPPCPQKSSPPFTPCSAAHPGSHDRRPFAGLAERAKRMAEKATCLKRSASARCPTPGHDKAAKPPDSERLRVDPRKTPLQGGRGRPGDPLSGPGQAREAGATGSRVAQQ